MEKENYKTPVPKGQATQTNNGAEADPVADVFVEFDKLDDTAIVESLAGRQMKSMIYDVVPCDKKSGEPLGGQEAVLDCETSGCQWRDKKYHRHIRGISAG